MVLQFAFRCSFFLFTWYHTAQLFLSFVICVEYKDGSASWHANGVLSVEGKDVVRWLGEEYVFASVDYTVYIHTWNCMAGKRHLYMERRKKRRFHHGPDHLALLSRFGLVFRSSRT